MGEFFSFLKPKAKSEESAGEQKKKPASRRSVLKVGILSTLLGAYASTLEFLKTTENKSRYNPQKINTTLLEQQVFSPTKEDVERAAQLLQSIVKDGVDWEPEDDLYEKLSTFIPDIFNAVAVLRNWILTNPADFSQALTTLLSLNISPFSNIEPYPDTQFNHEYLVANVQSIAKLEAFFAVRHLCDRELVPKTVQQEFQFKEGESVNYYSYSESTISQHTLRTDRGWSGKNSLDESLIFLGVPEKYANTEYTDEVIKRHWRTIRRAAEQFDIDPLYIAAIISMECRDKKVFELFDFHRSYRNKVKLTSLLFLEMDEEDEGIKSLLVKALDFLNQHKDIAKVIFPDAVSEDVVDYLGAVMGENTSVGLGQINIETARRFGLVQIGDRVFKPETPQIILSTLLTNPSINIFAIAAYTRMLIDTYTQMQKNGLNLYLPDLSENNPSNNHTNNLKGDPVYPTNFGITFFGALYTSMEYPEFNSELRPPYNIQVDLRFPPIANNWGDMIASYYYYYLEERDRLSLKI
jgi:hypothetical protein